MQAFVESRYLQNMQLFEDSCVPIDSSFESRRTSHRGLRRRRNKRLLVFYVYATADYWEAPASRLHHQHESDANLLFRDSCNNIGSGWRQFCKRSNFYEFHGAGHTCCNNRCKWEVSNSHDGKQGEDNWDNPIRIPELSRRMLLLLPGEGLDG